MSAKVKWGFGEGGGGAAGKNGGGGKDEKVVSARIEKMAEKSKQIKSK